MRPTYPIEQILGSRSRVRVLRELAGVRVPLNAAQIAARVGITRPAAGNVLSEFASMGLTENMDVGNARVHWLIHENIYVELVKRAFEFESHVADMLLEDLRKRFAEAAESVLLFGSYARGDQGQGSDIDVVLVGADERQKSDLDQLVADESDAFGRRWGVSLSVLTYTVDEAAALWRHSPELQRSLERDGVVVSGRGASEWRSGTEEE